MESAYLIIGAAVLGTLVLIVFIVLAINNHRAAQPRSWTPPEQAEESMSYDATAEPMPAPTREAAASPFGRVATGSPSANIPGQPASGGLGLLGGVIFLAAFGLVGLGLMGAVIFQGVRLVSSSSWPTTEGRVLSSHVDSYVDSEGDTMYSAEVYYEYIVGGATYRGDLIRFGSNSGSTSARRSQQRIVDNYPVGASILVYYNPDDPTDAVLERKLSFGIILMAFMGLTFGGVGIGVGGSALLKTLRGSA